VVKGRLQTDSESEEPAARNSLGWICGGLRWATVSAYLENHTDSTRIKLRESCFFIQLANCRCRTSPTNSFEEPNIIWIYRIIFVLYRSYVDLQGQEFEQVHAKLSRAFLLIKRIAEKEKANLSTKSALYQALDYYLTYYDGLTLFLTDRTIPMSNNRSERTLRNPVIGRKVWYGTHAVESARDQAKVLSLIESCKMLGVNPRKYTQDAVDRLHAGKVALSPYEYWRAQSNNSS
jgi:hypothetical protein